MNMTSRLYGLAQEYALYTCDKPAVWTSLCGMAMAQGHCPELGVGAPLRPTAEEANTQARWDIEVSIMILEKSRELPVEKLRREICSVRNRLDDLDELLWDSGIEEHEVLWVDA